MDTHERIEIEVGRWRSSLSQNEAHAIRCAIAEPLSNFLPEGTLDKKLCQLILDTETEYDCSLAKSGITKSMVWLDFGDIRIWLRASQSLRLWNHLRIGAGLSWPSATPEDDLVDEDSKRSLNIGRR
jgi:hypothetical protein